MKSISERCFWAKRVEQCNCGFQSLLDYMRFKRLSFHNSRSVLSVLVLYVPIQGDANIKDVRMEVYSSDVVD
jgi:hypothetical protein